MREHVALLAQRAALGTSKELSVRGAREVLESRGESAYVVEIGGRYLATVTEALGTKNLVADAVHKATGKNFYREIAIDTVATIVNDLITTGALPISVAMHAAVGAAAYAADAARMEALARSLAEGCAQAGAVWGGGETPTLRGIVNPSTIVLAGSAVGKIAPKSLRITGDIRDGDAIVFLASSGIQTNGLTLSRQIAERLPNGYGTPIGHGDTRTFGEAPLAPSVIYAAFVRECQQRGVKLNYLAHVTGHGWRKLMRLDEPFVYEITEPREAPALFEFMIEAGPIDRREAYATFNMGVGFAAYVHPDDAHRTLLIARQQGYTAWIGGTVHRIGSRKGVDIEPLGIHFEAESLQVR